MAFTLKGVDEVSEKLKTLSDRVEVNKRTKFAARKAMQLVLFAAKVGASRIDDPETRSRIQDNVAIRVGKSRDLNTVRMRVGVMGGAAVNARSNMQKLNALPGGMTIHWRYVEFGTSKIPATPFMRPALENNIQAVTDEFVTNFKKTIDRAIAKGKLK